MVTLYVTAFHIAGHMALLIHMAGHIAGHMCMLQVAASVTVISDTVHNGLRSRPASLCSAGYGPSSVS